MGDEPPMFSALDDAFGRAEQVPSSRRSGVRTRRWAPRSGTYPLAFPKMCATRGDRSSRAFEDWIGLWDDRHRE